LKSHDEAHLIVESAELLYFDRPSLHWTEYSREILQ